MRIGIISNSEALLPLAYTLATQKLQVYVFFSGSNNPYVTQKVREFASQTHTPLNEEKNVKNDLYEWINQMKLDVCFVTGYCHLILLSKIHKPSPAIFNIHFGPLPAYKGPTPVFWQLKHGAKHLGISIHRLTEKFDDGPVVWFKNVPNQDFFNYEVVNKHLSNISIEGVIFILNRITQNTPIIPINIPDKSHTAYYKRPGADDVTIHWDKMPAAEICNLVKACNPWNKGAITFFQGKEVKIMDAYVIDNTTNTDVQEAGTIVEVGNHIGLYTCDKKTILTYMLFFNDCYVPERQWKHWGILTGQRFIS